MSVGAATGLRFVAEYAELLIEITGRGVIREAEFHQIVRRHAGNAVPENVIERLREYNIVDDVPGASASVELAVPVAEFLRHFMREERLTSHEVVEGYLRSVESLGADIDRATVAVDETLLLHGLSELTRDVERMRSDSAHSREAIFREIERLKANTPHLPLSQRFVIVNRIWERHVQPMREMIGGRLRTVVDRARDILETAVAEFERDRVLTAEIATLDARIVRLQRALFEDHHASVAAVTPLHEQIRRESAIARGAALFLERSLQPGERTNLQQLLPIHSFRRENLVNDAQLRQIVTVLANYQPPAPLPIPSPVGVVPSIILTDALLAQIVRPALPVPDALAWLVNRFEELPLATVLTGFAWFLSEQVPGIRAIATGGRREHHLADVTLVAPIVRLEDA